MVQLFGALGLPEEEEAEHGGGEVITGRLPTAVVCGLDVSCESCMSIGTGSRSKSPVQRAGTAAVVVVAIRGGEEEDHVETGVGFAPALMFPVRVGGAVDGLPAGDPFQMGGAVVAATGVAADVDACFESKFPPPLSSSSSSFTVNMDVVLAFRKLSR